VQGQVDKGGKKMSKRKVKELLGKKRGGVVEGERGG